MAVTFAVQLGAPECQRRDRTRSKSIRSIDPRQKYSGMTYCYVVDSRLLGNDNVNDRNDNMNDRNDN